MSFIFKNGVNFIGSNEDTDAPFLTDNITEAVSFDSAENASNWLKDAYPNATLMKLEYRITEVPRPYYNSIEDKRQQALAKLTSEEKILLGL